MYSNHTPFPQWLTRLLLAIVLIVASQFELVAEELRQAYLRIKPSQCVSLRQGQDCYVQLSINWQAPVKGNYCLYSAQGAEAILCWQNQNAGTQQIEIKINGDTRFWLQAQGSDEVVAETLVKQAWVHKKQRLSFSSWRIF